MKFSQFIITALMICFSCINAEVEQPCPVKTKSVNFDWVENHKNSNEEKWQFLRDIYKKYEKEIEIVRSTPQSEAKEEKSFPYEIFSSLDINPSFIEYPTDKSSLLFKYIMKIQAGKHYDIYCLLSNTEYGESSREVENKKHKWDDYIKFLIDDINRLSTEKVKPNPHMLGRPTKIKYPCSSEIDQEFFNAAQTLLDALYAIRILSSYYWGLIPPPKYWT